MKAEGEKHTQRQKHSETETARLKQRETKMKR